MEKQGWLAAGTVGDGPGPAAGAPGGRWWCWEIWMDRGPRGRGDRQAGTGVQRAWSSTRARALRRPSLSLSTTSLCSWAKCSASWADTSSLLSPEIFSSSCSRRPRLRCRNQRGGGAVSSGQAGGRGAGGRGARGAQGSVGGPAGRFPCPPLPLWGAGRGRGDGDPVLPSGARRPAPHLACSPPLCCAHSRPPPCSSAFSAWTGPPSSSSPPPPAPGPFSLSGSRGGGGWGAPGPGHAPDGLAPRPGREHGRAGRARARRPWGCTRGGTQPPGPGVLLSRLPRAPRALRVGLPAAPSARPSARCRPSVRSPQDSLMGGPSSPALSPPPRLPVPPAWSRRGARALESRRPPQLGIRASGP